MKQIVCRMRTDESGKASMINESIIIRRHFNNTVVLFGICWRFRHIARLIAILAFNVLKVANRNKRIIGIWSRCRCLILHITSYKDKQCCVCACARAPAAIAFDSVEQKHFACLFAQKSAHQNCGIVLLLWLCVLLLLLSSLVEIRRVNACIRPHSRTVAFARKQQTHAFIALMNQQM